jgi:hypothetical protein
MPDNRQMIASRYALLRIAPVGTGVLLVLVFAIRIFRNHLSEHQFLILILIAELLAAALLAGIFLDVYRSHLNRKVIHPQKDLSVDDRASQGGADMLSIVPEGMLNKYDMEIFACRGISLLFLMPLMPAAYMWLRDPFQGDLAFFLITVVLASCSWLLFRLPEGSARERDLAREYSRYGIYMHPQGLICNIALLEGPYRRFLAGRKQGIAEIAWHEIDHLEIESLRGLRRAQPYLKIVLKTPIDIPNKGKYHEHWLKTLFVPRRVIKGHERKIVDYVKRHTSSCIIVDGDELE